MKPLPLFLIALVPLLTIIGCGKSKDEAPPVDDTPKIEKLEAPHKPAGPDFSSWNQAEKARAWQGSWLAKENGTIQAWTVTGETVQTWDGTEEKSYSLVVDAPCRVGFKTDGGIVYPRNFSAVDGKLRYGAGGFRRGAEAIFCDDSGDIYALDAEGKCSLWKEDFGEWTRSDGECAIEKNDAGAEMFSHGEPNSGSFAIEGEAIVPRSSFPTEPVAGDFSAAKTARDTKAAE